MERYRHAKARKDGGAAAAQATGSTSHAMTAAALKGPRPELMEVNSCIRRFTRLLTPPVKSNIRLRTALTRSEVMMLGYPTRIADMFFALVECAARFAPGGSVTVLTTLLPLAASVLPNSGRCALVSFHVAPRQGERISNSGDDPLDALSHVREVVQEHHGCFSMVLHAAEITINIYLPVIPRFLLAPGGKNI